MAPEDVRFKTFKYITPQMVELMTRSEPYAYEDDTNIYEYVVTVKRVRVNRETLHGRIRELFKKNTDWYVRGGLRSVANLIHFNYKKEGYDNDTDTRAGRNKVERDAD